MQIKTAVLLLLMIVSGIFYYNLTSESDEVITAKVVRVIDGDTVELEDFSKVRLKGINAPESFMTTGNVSTKFLENLVFNKTVEIASFGYDKYDRILGYLILDDKNINSKILKEGLATLYYYEEDKYFKEMTASEEFARINEIGIWKKSNNFYCLSVVEFSHTEPEKLVLNNSCNKEIEVLIKDDATHIYEETLDVGEFVLETSHVWNDGGDSVYIYDESGLVEFSRY